MSPPRSALRHAPNWFQFARFVLVGASGFVVNLVIFASLVHVFDVHYLVAALISNPIALVNNYVLHRHWTFKAQDVHKRHQATRFILVCVFGFAVNLAILRFSVESVGMTKVLAEVVAALGVAPFTFIGNRQWAFRQRRVQVA